MMTISKGAKVYRVVEFDPPQEMAPHTWRIEEREVKAVHRNGDIMLVRPFYLTERRLFGKEALGLSLFTSPVDAIRDFANKQRRNIQSAQNILHESNRALTWAEQWAQANVSGLTVIDGGAP